MSRFAQGVTLWWRPTTRPQQLQDIGIPPEYLKYRMVVAARPEQDVRHPEWVYVHFPYNERELWHVLTDLVQDSYCPKRGGQ